jgi:hypothetical protein
MKDKVKSDFTETTRAVVKGEECQLILNDGVNSKPRVVKVVAADELGIHYNWSFRGSERTNFDPWPRIAELRRHIGKGTGQGLPKAFPTKASVNASINPFIGKWAILTLTDGLRPSERKAYVVCADRRGLCVAYSHFGQEYVAFISHTLLVDCEIKTKKAQTPGSMPPGAKKKAAEKTK